MKQSGHKGEDVNRTHTMRFHPSPFTGNAPRKGTRGVPAELDEAIPLNKIKYKEQHDEKNTDDRHHSYYAYDHAGGSCGSRAQSQACLSYAEMQQRRQSQRAMKVTGHSHQLDVNADLMHTAAGLDEFTLYPSPYLVFTNRGYTKHYYAGTERLAARIGGGNLDHDTACIVMDEEAMERADRLFDWCLRQVKETVIVPLDLSSLDIRTIDGDRMDAPWWLDEAPTGLEAGLKLNVWKILHAMDLLSSPSTVPPDTDDEPDVYFYHSDHLGSASWITDGDGMPVQHLQYLPFGEPFVNQRVSDYSERFTFTGKEKDEETGYSYFSARYLDHEILTSFLSVDRYADKYPSISPYVYCAWNPIKLIDPTGDTIFNAHEQYRDISQDLQKLDESLKNATGNEKKDIRRKIKELKNNHEKYKRVQGALDAFKKANPEEYTRLDNLEYNGKSVNITIEASGNFESGNKASGVTHPHFLYSLNTDEIIGVGSIGITLFKKAFLGGYCGLSTLANEFGDAIFAVERPQYQYDNYKNLETQRQQGNTDYYYREPSSRFSFDYEAYITRPNRNKKPNPYDY